MTIRDFLAGVTEVLGRAGIPTPSLDAQVLVADSLGVDRPWLFAHDMDVYDPKRIGNRVTRRLAGEPIAYIVGWREFFGRRFAVGPGVLIPRPETEILVQAVLDLATTGVVVDFGAGSGCISHTLALECPRMRVFGMERDPEALIWANRNRTSLCSDARLLRAEDLKGFALRSVDALVSNPPYVATSDALGPGVAEFEPSGALFAGEDGLDAYRMILEQAGPILKPQARVFFEIGMGQHDAIVGLASAFGFVEIDRRLDLAGIMRVLVFEPAS
ncbi:MAG: peptide chain release factor N(5)-glutamine methyltransferase [Armatimonadetes bacterium]|nr:peptide chain release factor N(5)-glutamine methyltransferase [Armatimonadota bacterium]